MFPTGPSVRSIRPPRPVSAATASRAQWAVISPSACGQASKHHAAGVSRLRSPWAEPVFFCPWLKGTLRRRDYWSVINGEGAVLTVSFEDIEREFGPMVRRIAASHEADRHLAEELVQDIWLVLWRALPAFRGESSLRTFVARVATYRAITHVRRGARVPRPDEVPEDLAAYEPGPEEHAIGRDQQSKLLAAVRA